MYPSIPSLGTSIKMSIILINESAMFILRAYSCLLRPFKIASVTVSIYINIGRNDRVRVITGDGLIKLAAWRQGVMRMSAREFEKDVDAAYERMRKMLKDIGNVDPVTFGEKLRQALEKNKK